MLGDYRSSNDRRNFSLAMAHLLAHSGIRTLRQCPVQERKSIRFVIVGYRVGQCLHGSNHLCLVRVGGRQLELPGGW